MTMEQKLSALENIWNRQPRLIENGDTLKWSDIGWKPFTVFGQRPPREEKRKIDETVSIIKKDLRFPGFVLFCFPLTGISWTRFLLAYLHLWISLGDAFDGVGLFVNEKARMICFAPEEEADRLSSFCDRNLWVGL
jgi:hypothetical protein